MLKHQNESGPRIPIVMDAVRCKKHKADKGKPCWTLRLDVDKRLAPAVCGQRTKLAGFSEPKPQESMSSKPSGKTPGKPSYANIKATKQGRPRPTSSRAKDKA